MKMTLAHYDYLKDRIAAQSKFIPQYREHIANNPRVKNAEMRLRWDMLHNSVDSGWICENLYPYLDDTHIDTALRAVMDSIAN